MTLLRTAAGRFLRKNEVALRITLPNSIRSSRPSISSFAQAVLGNDSRPPGSLILGCVCYDHSVGDIWGGIQNYFLNEKGLYFDYVLFASYESQVQALLDSRIDVAWNGPIAHVMCEELVGEASKSNGTMVSLGMRDVDRDFESIIVVRKDANIKSMSDLNDRHILTGSRDSPQAHVVPLYALLHNKNGGIKPASVTPFDYDIGKHGDTAIGEIEALKALSSTNNQRGDLALVSRMMWQRALDGLISGLDSKQLKETCEVLESVQLPPFDHCQFDAILTSDKEQKLNDFGEALLGMDMTDPEQGRLMKSEGISKQWMLPKQTGYDIVRKAMGVSANHRCSTNFPFRSIRSFSTTKSIPSASNQRIAVIGAGVAGLQAIRALQGRGFPVTAFEASANVGGLWQENYSNFGVQVPKELFEFQDYPMNSVKWGDYASGQQVQSYIESFADVYGLRNAVQFKTRVISATQQTQGNKTLWKIEIEQEGKRSIQEFDYLVVATGLYSGLNKVTPPIPGLRDKFRGTIVHSSEFTNATIAKNKRVVVIGGGKSAVDCAVEASRAGAAGPVVLLQRKAHWPTPRKIAGVIPFQYIFLSRFGTALVGAHTGPYPGGSGKVVNAFRNTVGPFIVKPVFRAVEELFAFQFGLRGELRPQQDVVKDFYDVALVLNSDLQNMRKNGDVQVQLGEIKEVNNDGNALLLNNGDLLEADVIVYAAGFDQDYGIFDEPTRRDLDLQSDGVYLHRYILPEKVPSLAFIGHVAAISNISSYGLQAEWLARYLTGDLVSGGTPNHKEIEARKAWARSWIPDSVKRGMLVLLHQTHYHDQLLRDMGENPHRKSNVLAEYLMPYESADYNGIMGGSMHPIKGANSSN